MNYIKEINNFMDWLEINPLEATTQTLWFHIMSIANKCGWPEWFTIANLTLMAKVGISENTLIKHRNILIQKGRIEYKNQGKQKAGKYRIISFTSNIEVSREVNLEVNREVKCEVNPSALNKLNETKLNNIYSTSTGAKDQVHNNFDDEFSELAKLYQQVIGQPNGLTAEWISIIKDTYGFEWVKNAMIEAERRGKRTKKYIEGILDNWKVNGGMKLSTDKKESQQPNVVSRKTKFHNFEGRSEKYTNDQLEDIVARKRREARERMRGVNSQ